MTDIQLLQVIESDHEYRIMACRAPANDCYVEKLVLLAMPNLTDAQPKIVGQLCVSVDSIFEVIEWIEVDADHRLQGIGKRLWRAAEKVLNRSLVHSPVTDDGEAFAEAMMKSSKQTTRPTPTSD